MGSKIGILGGGQLARMLAVSASRIGYLAHVYDPDPSSPAFEVVSNKTIGSFKDTCLLKRFAKTVDVMTYEFENVPEAALIDIEKIIPIFPRKNALAISQNRIEEKKFFQSLGLKTAQYALVNSFESFLAAEVVIKTPSILKTCSEGYDGKGQLRITGSTKKSEVKKHLLQGPCVLESFVPFYKEISVIIARSNEGQVVSYDPGENIHESGILKKTIVPSEIPRKVQLDSVIIAGKIINALNYVGVLGVELFLKRNGELLVNEIAPRVHNSGHWTQNGCAIDQFEQHIRAITGRKLGDGKRHSNVTMVNLLGQSISRADEIESAALHIYGKAEIRTGRKMGHINYISPMSQ